jgi:hypothetical protein
MLSCLQEKVVNIFLFIHIFLSDFFTAGTHGFDWYVPCGLAYAIYDFINPFIVEHIKELLLLILLLVFVMVADHET